MNIRILTDSASDFTLDELNANNVGLIPMPLQCGEETRIDDKTTPVEIFWDMLIGGIDIKTSQPSPEAFIEKFEDAKKAGDAVICILIAAKLSGTYQCALLARSMVDYEHIYIVDSQNAAASEKMLVLHACKLRDTTDMTAPEIVAELEKFRSRIRLFACLDTLEYLARGGRLPKTAASIGTVMKVKPIIIIAEGGEIKVVKKVMGANHAMKEMVSEVLSFDISSEYATIPIYAQNNENCLEYIKRLKENGLQNEIKEPEPIGATIGTYIGPGGYGIVFVDKNA